MILEATKGEHAPAGNEILAEDLAMTAGRWINSGISTSAVLESFRLAVEVVDNPFRFGSYAAKVVKSLDNGIRVEPALSSRQSVPMRPARLSPTELNRQQRKAAHLALSPRKGGSND